MTTPTPSNRIALLLSVLRTADEALQEAATVAAAMPRILAAIGLGLNWELGASWRHDESADVLCCVAIWHAVSVDVGDFEAASYHTLLPIGVGLPGRIWASGEQAWIADVTQDGNFPRAAFAATAGLHGAFGFPIRSEGQTLGVMEFFSRNVEPPAPDLLAMMASVGVHVGHFQRMAQVREALQRDQERLNAERAAFQQEVAQNERVLAQVRDCVMALLTHPEAPDQWMPPAA